MAASAGPPDATVAVAIADDHPVVRAGLRSLLEDDADLAVVAEFDDLATATQRVPTLRPAVLLLDLAMGGRSSLPAVPGLLASTPGLHIIILTMQEDPGFAREALRLGAHGYVLKDAAADELLLAVRSVVRGSTYLHPALGAQIATQAASTSVLSDREQEVLRMIAAGHTNQEIASRLFLSLRTVEAHRGQLRTKLGLETRAELSAFARENGMVP